MNYAFGIVICSSVLCHLSVFAAETTSPITTSTSTHTITTTTTTTSIADSLVVPPVKPWVAKAREVKEQQRREPEVITMLKTCTGKEKEGDRFCDTRSNRHLLENYLEHMVIDFDTQKVEELLMLCDQKHVEIPLEMCEELFKSAYTWRTASEENYKKNMEGYAQNMKHLREKQIRELNDKLAQCKKATEGNINTWGITCSQLKNGSESAIKTFTTIMQLTQKLNPQFRPAYATNPALYYEDIEKEFGLQIKLAEQTALATHMQELSKIIIAMSQFGKIDTVQPSTNNE